MKISTGFVKEYKEQQQEVLRQQKLREKHQIEDSAIKVVEKPSILINLLKISIRGFKFLCIILLLTLATIGVISLSYPHIRTEIINILIQIKEQYFR